MLKHKNVFMIFVLTALFATSCQPKIKHEVDVKGKVEPVEVKHNIVLDTKLLYKAYQDECALLYTAEEDINNCADDKLNDFIENFTTQS